MCNTLTKNIYIFKNIYTSLVLAQGIELTLLSKRGLECLPQGDRTYATIKAGARMPSPGG